MTGQLTMYGASVLLGSYFGGWATPPENLYVAVILDVEPNAYVSGGELDEPTVIGYSRAVVPNDGFNFRPTAQNIMTVVNEITFLDAQDDWGTIRYWAICDDITEGKPIFVGKLTQPVQVLQGDVLKVPANDFDVELGPFYATWET